MESKELLSWLKKIHEKEKAKDFRWKPIYRNNKLGDYVDGIYTDMFFEKNGKYTYVKYSIQYVSRCDEFGFSYPSEGVKYYVLHELQIDNLDETWEIPAPSKELGTDNELDRLVSNYGKFRYVFDDVDTAKSVAGKYILGAIYPLVNLLNADDLEEWNKFVMSQ